MKNLKLNLKMRAYNIESDTNREEKNCTTHNNKTICINIKILCFFFCLKAVLRKRLRACFFFSSFHWLSTDDAVVIAAIAFLLWFHLVI